MKFQKTAAAVLACLGISCLAKPLTETQVFNADNLPEGTVIPGTKNYLMQAPTDGAGKVLCMEYPKYINANSPEWPAVYMDLPKYGPYMVPENGMMKFYVFNPQSKNMDMGVCMESPQGRQTIHFLLQANEWNTCTVPCSRIRETWGEKITHIDFFMTRPASDTKYYLKSFGFTDGGLSTDRILNAKNSMIEFEENEAIEAIDSKGMTFERSEEWAKNGKQSAKLHFTASAETSRQTFRIWPALDTETICDWSLFTTVEFTTYNTLSKARSFSFSVLDGNGGSFTKECTLTPGQENTFDFPLNEMKLNLKHVQLLEFFMENPEEDCQFFVDSLSLDILDKKEMDVFTDKINTLLAGLAAVENINTNGLPLIKEKYMKMLDDMRKISASLENGNISVREIQELQAAQKKVQESLQENSREAQEISLLSKSAHLYPQAPFAVCTADSMTKVMIKDMPLNNVTVAEKIQLELAKNEYESFQIAAVSPAKEVTAEVKVSALKNGDYELPDNAVTVSLVGHVNTKTPPYKVSYRGWWPDPLLDWQTSAKVQPGDAVSFWIRIKTPENAAAGIYSGNVQVLADGENVATIPLNVRVFDFTVPTKSPLDTAMDYRDIIRQLWGKDMSDEQYHVYLQQIADKLIEYKIDLDSIYRVAKEDPSQMFLPVDILKKQKEAGVLRCFNILYVVSTPKDCKSLDDPRIQQKIDLCVNALDYWVPILEKEGLMEYAYIYGFDEVPEELFPVMAKVLKGIKEKYPNIPIATTAYDHSFGTKTCLSDAVDIFTPLTPRFNLETVKLARSQGRKVWWYICIVPKNPYANWFIEYQAIESRLLMGAMTAKYRPDGFLYYAINRWPVNKAPITSGPYTDWNPASFQTANGDGSIFCAGPNGIIPTIRAENFRDGLEDFAYVLELENRLKNAADISEETRKAAEEALQVPEELVKTLSVYSHDPETLRNYRRKIATAIESLK